MKKMITVLVLAVLLGTVLAVAQSDGGPQGGPPEQRRKIPSDEPGMGQMMRHGGPDFPMRGPGGPMGAPGGKWWKNTELAQHIGLTDAQAQQIEKIMQDHRLQLIDLHAALEKADAQLDPLMEVDQPNEAQVSAQIDRVASARAALEKSNALMLLAIRRVLSAEQWKKLQAEHQGVYGGIPGGVRGGPGGPGPGGMRERRPGPPPHDDQ